MQQVRSVQRIEVATLSARREQALHEANVSEGISNGISEMLQWAEDGEDSDNGQTINADHVVKLDREAYAARLRCEKYADTHAKVTDNMDAFLSPIVQQAQLEAAAHWAAGSWDSLQDIRRIHSGYTSGYTKDTQRIHAGYTKDTLQDTLRIHEGYTQDTPRIHLGYTAGYASGTHLRPHINGVCVCACVCVCGACEQRSARRRTSARQPARTTSSSTSSKTTCTHSTSSQKETFDTRMRST